MTPKEQLGREFVEKTQPDPRSATAEETRQYNRDKMTYFLLLDIRDLLAEKK